MLLSFNPVTQSNIRRVRLSGTPFLHLMTFSTKVREKCLRGGMIIWISHVSGEVFQLLRGLLIWKIYQRCCILLRAPLYLHKNKNIFWPTDNYMQLCVRQWMLVTLCPQHYSISKNLTGSDTCANEQVGILIIYDVVINISCCAAGLLCSYLHACVAQFAWCALMFL